MINEAVKEVERKVRDHFHSDAERFDSIYRTNERAVARSVDDYWRGVVQNAWKSMLKSSPR